MGYKKDKNFSYEVIENCGTIEESDKNNWGVALTRISWNGKPPVYDLRNYDLSTIETDEIVMGKGVSLNNEESLDVLLYKLLEMGFGNRDEIINILNERDSIYIKSPIKKIKIKHL